MKVRNAQGFQWHRTVDFDDASNEVLLIDQNVLPHEFRTLRTSDFVGTAEAIERMTVRGAGAIGAAAAWGFAQGIRAWPDDKHVGREFFTHIDRVFQVLGTARPTAVDPMNALRWMRRNLDHAASSSVAEWKRLALSLARQFSHENIEDCKRIGEHGSALICDQSRVLTHCNAGWLAFVDYGSATAPIYNAWDQGKRFHVFCDETRPRLQGSALTAWELYNHGVDHTIIADNAAGFLMSRKQIDMVITGSDRVIAATGEVANKIGTYTKAVLAHHHRIPFYIAIPMSTIDWDLRSGEDIPIEQRHENEIHEVRGMSATGSWEKIRVSNPGSSAQNYGFDITPAELITGIITPHGIFHPRDLKNLPAHFRSF